MAWVLGARRSASGPTHGLPRRRRAHLVTHAPRSTTSGARGHECRHTATPCSRSCSTPPATPAPTRPRASLTDAVRTEGRPCPWTSEQRPAALRRRRHQCRGHRVGRAGPGRPRSPTPRCSSRQCAGWSQPPRRLVGHHQADGAGPRRRAGLHAGPTRHRRGRHRGGPRQRRRRRRAHLHARVAGASAPIAITAPAVEGPTRCASSPAAPARSTGRPRRSTSIRRRPAPPGLERTGHHPRLRQARVGAPERPAGVSRSAHQRPAPDRRCRRRAADGGRRRDWRYLLVEDPIPAGTEAMPARDAYPLVARHPVGADLSQQEFRDDRSAFFLEASRTAAPTSSTC